MPLRTSMVLLLLGGLALLPLDVQAQLSFADQKIPQKAEVQGAEQPLWLRGHARLDRNMLPWYALALHGDLRVRRPEAFGEALEACRITLVWLENEASEAAVREHFSQLFARTVPVEVYDQLAPRIEQFVAQLPAARRGQVWRFDYWPDAGMRILVNDQPLERVAGFDMNAAVLGLWLGEKADPGVRAQLTEQVRRR